jgi:hypothetical protein
MLLVLLSDICVLQCSSSTLEQGTSSWLSRQHYINAGGLVQHSYWLSHGPDPRGLTSNPYPTLPTPVARTIGDGKPVAEF